MVKVEELEAMASVMVGDGKHPNLYFVSHVGLVFMVTTDRQVAYEAWASLPRSVETAMEDRKVGTLCSTEPDEDGSSTLVTYDDVGFMTKRRNNARTRR